MKQYLYWRLFNVTLPFSSSLNTYQLEGDLIQFTLCVSQFLCKPIYVKAFLLLKFYFFSVDSSQFSFPLVKGFAFLIFFFFERLKWVTRLLGI